MDIGAFIQFTFHSRYMPRWIYGGLIVYIPILNFFSFGYLKKTSRLLMLGSIGLPTWEERKTIWSDGMKLLFIFVLYGAIPFFLFSCGFFLTTLSTITAFFGHIMTKLSIVALLCVSFFVPFAFAVFAEKDDFREALDFERILQGIKEVLAPYLGGYICALIALGICLLITRIPYLIGLLLSSLCTYYVFLVSAYYFTQLYRRTSLAMERMVDEPVRGAAPEGDKNIASE